MHQTITFDLDLIHRYDKSGPRYTSYPTAVQFHDGFTEQDYRRHAQLSNAGGNPLSLYFHIPFCDTVCFYCACNKIVTKNRSLSSPYLEHLHQELAEQSQLFDPQRPVTQLHWGGGTPTFLNPEQMTELMNRTRQAFQLLDDDSGEYSIEIDPREANADTIALLRRLGFNRMSLGVQDFDEKVQKAVNRIQSEEQTFAVLNAARQQGFKSISLDLIYGLPFQTVDSFLKTLEKIVAVQPDRLSIFNYAHLPSLFKPQRRIIPEELPTSAQKLDILQATINFLAEAGYVYIGMDHFSKPDDELAIAQRQGTLYRNFQGYSTHADCDLIGLGVTSISKVHDCYSQNVKKTDEYYPQVAAGHIPIFRGVTLTQDDKLRRELIMQLMCHFSLNIPQVEAKHSLNFKQHFANEWKQLGEMQQDGLLERSDEQIEILPAGRLLVRNIAMVFDVYLRNAQEQRFSKVI